MIPATGGLLGVERERHPQLVAPGGKLKAAGHHSNDGVAFAIQTNRLADHTWIAAESVLP